jgi:hypothetical protein
MLEMVCLFRGNILSMIMTNSFQLAGQVVDDVLMMDWLKMLCRNMVMVNAHTGDNGSVIEGDHNTLDVENSAQETSDHVRMLER